jgi:hypothetical protein
MEKTYLVNTLSKFEKLERRMDMQNAPIVSLDAFQKNPDGSWTCIANTDIKSNGSIIRINPGVTFRKSRPQWGIDVAEFLEQAASSKQE